MSSLRAIFDHAIACVQATAPDEARLKCEWLVSHILGLARLELPMRLDQAVTESQRQKIEAGAARLAKGEPLQYALGEADFMGHAFICDRRALIPRPETEQLVAWVMEDRTLRQIPSPNIAEVGAGSGCIAITLALIWPQAHYIATDISNEALDLARENAARHGVTPRIRFIACNLLSIATPQTTFQHSTECWNVVTADPTPFLNLDAIVSNPPYVRTANWRQLDRTVRDFEPRTALDGGANGLTLIRPLIEQAYRALKAGGLLFLEIGDDQGADVAELLYAAGFGQIEGKRDLAGKNRMVRAVKDSMN